MMSKMSLLPQGACNPVGQKTDTPRQFQDREVSAKTACTRVSLRVCRGAFCLGFWESGKASQRKCFESWVCRGVRLECETVHVGVGQPMTQVEGSRERQYFRPRTRQAQWWACLELRGGKRRGEDSWVVRV